MATLDLVRTTSLRLDDNPPRCVTEPRRGVSPGSLALISPARPGDRAPWRRRPVERSGETFLPSLDGGRGATWYAYNDLADGAYEAHSVLALPRRSHRVVFRVEGGEIAVLGEDATPGEVLEALGWRAEARPRLFR